MKKVIIASALGAVILLATGAARAENACDGEIQKTKSDWQALRLEPASKPMGIAKGVNGHKHITAEVASMRFHLVRAQDLCKAGNDHEALLHLDVIRAFLKIPEIQHPVDHHYLFDDKSK